MSKMVTRCPKCQTSFRVTEEHLRIANGAVRCGSCLHVFQAREHWVEDKPATPASAASSTASGVKSISVPSFLKGSTPSPSAAPVAPTPTKPASKFQFDQSAIDNAAPKGKFSFDQSAIDNSSASSLLKEPDKRIPETTLTRAHAAPDPIDPIDADDAHDGTVFGDDGPASTGQPSSTDKSAVQVKDFGTEDDDYSSLFGDDDDVTAITAEDYSALLDEDGNALDEYENASDDSQLGEDDNPEPEEEDAAWAKDLLKELEDEAPTDTATHDAPQAHYIDPVDADVARRDLGIDDDSAYALAQSNIRSFLSGEADTPAPLPTAPIDTPAPAPAPTAPRRERPQHAPLFGALDEEMPTATAHPERTELLARIVPDAINIQGAAEDRQKRRQFIQELSACVTLSLLLVAQIIGFNFNALAKQDSTRPAMETLCQVLRCQLPPSQRWRNIRITNLVVRQHPNIPNALVVDAIITNGSSKELPFPALELYFNDIDQLPVASRRFQPPEYVKGELLGQTMMPPGHPIHIAFDVMNPGEKAVNWRMDVTPFD